MLNNSISPKVLDPDISNWGASHFYWIEFIVWWVFSREHPPYFSSQTAGNDCRPGPSIYVNTNVSIKQIQIPRDKRWGRGPKAGILPEIQNNWSGRSRGWDI